MPGIRSALLKIDRFDWHGILSAIKRQACLQDGYGNKRSTKTELFFIAAHHNRIGQVGNHSGELYYRQRHVIT